MTPSAGRPLSAGHFRTYRLVVALGLATTGACFSGCSTPPYKFQLPPQGPARQDVLETASDVVRERYPMSTVSMDGGYLLAVTSPQMEGGARTMRRISVLVEQNYTGHFQPLVRVQHDVDVATPTVAEVDATHPLKASPFGKSRWRVMGYLEHEEVALTRAILDKLSAQGM